MKLISSPPFWLFFGFIGYPIVCIVNGLLGIFLTTAFFGDSIYAYGHAEEMVVWVSAFCGVALGFISMLSASAWKSRRFITARYIALFGGLAAVSFWLVTMIFNPSGMWLPIFGFLLPPLVWAACLILFAVYARVPKGEA